MSRFRRTNAEIAEKLAVETCKEMRRAREGLQQNFFGKKFIFSSDKISEPELLLLRSIVLRNYANYIIFFRQRTKILSGYVEFVEGVSSSKLQKAFPNASFLKVEKNVLQAQSVQDCHYLGGLSSEKEEHGELREIFGTKNFRVQFEINKAKEIVESGGTFSDIVHSTSSLEAAQFGQIVDVHNEINKAKQIVRTGGSLSNIIDATSSLEAAQFGQIVDVHNEITKAKQIIQSGGSLSDIVHSTSSLEAAQFGQFLKSRREIDQARADILAGKTLKACVCEIKTIEALKYCKLFFEIINS